MSHADPDLISDYFNRVTKPALDRAAKQGVRHTLKCGHDWVREATRVHVGDVICGECGRQDHVYDWAFYNGLKRIPERKRGSLQPEPQGGPWA